MRLKRIPKLWNKYDENILVLGIMFSGTSILASYLSSHPNVVIISEVGGGIERRILGKPITGVKLITPHQYRKMPKVYQGLRMSIAGTYNELKARFGDSVEIVEL